MSSHSISIVGLARYPYSVIVSHRTERYSSRSLNPPNPPISSLCTVRLSYGFQVETVMGLRVRVRFRVRVRVKDRDRFRLGVSPPSLTYIHT